MATTAKSSTQRKRTFVLTVRDQKGRELGFLNPLSGRGVDPSTTLWLERSAKRVLETGEFFPIAGFAKESKKEYIALSAYLDAVAEEIGIEEGTAIHFYFVQKWNRGKKKTTEWFITKFTERKLTVVKRRLKQKLTGSQLKKLTDDRLEKIFFPGGEEIKY